MTQPWLKFRDSNTAVEDVSVPDKSPGAETGPWQRYRNTATPEDGLRHEVLPSSDVTGVPVPKPSKIMHQGMAKVLGETAASLIDYLPPAMIANMWGDAFAAEKANPGAPNAATGGLYEFENTMRGVSQGTNPHADEGQKALGVVTSEDDAGTKYYTDAEGKEQPVLGNVVALRDPATGRLTAYSRSKQADESGATGLSRVVSAGLLAAPVTGVARATALVGPAAGEVAGTRSAAAAGDLAAFNRSNVPVFPPAFSEGPMRGLAKSLSDTPVIGAPLSRSFDNAVAGAAERADEIAGQIGSKPNPQQAGTTVREGIERFKDARPADVVEDGIKKLDDNRLSQIILAPTAETSFKTKQGALYERAWRLIPEAMQQGRAVEGQSRFMSAPSATREVLDGIAARNTRMINSQGGKVEAPPMAGGLLGDMIAAVRSPKWRANLQTLRDMRSEVRRLASGMADTEKNVLKASDLDRIQSALTQDMVAQLQANAARYLKDGNTEAAAKIERAIKEFSRADQYTRLSIERMDKIEKLFRADTGEALARNIANAALGGGRGNIEMLQTLNRTLRPDEMGEVKSMLFSELGRPVASARGTAQETGFSVNSFTTRWNAMSPEAKALLFSGDHAAAIDDFVKVANRLANVDAMGNVSRSGTHAVNIGGVLAAGGSLVSGSFAPLLGSAAGGYGLSYLLSRPTYARWAAQYIALKAQAQRAPQAINAAVATQINRLAQMAQSDPQLEPIVRSLTSSRAGEDGVSERSRENGDPEHRLAPAEKGKGRQDGELPVPRHTPINTDGSVLKEGPKTTLRDRAAEFIGGVTGGDRTHKNADYDAVDALSLIPPVGAVVGIDEARAMSDEGSPVAAAGLGILNMLPGGRAAKKGAEEALGAVTREIEQLAPRYRQLFGKEFVAPKARPGSAPEDILRGEQQTLEELKSAISGREAAIAKAPEQTTTPKLTSREPERDELMQQARANPGVKAVPGRQGLPKKQEELDAIKRFYDNGGSLPAGPWGRDPLDYQKAVREEFQATRQRMEDLKQERAVAKSQSEVARLTEELKAANKKAVEYAAIIAKLQKIILGDGGG